MNDEDFIIFVKFSFKKFNFDLSGKKDIKSKYGVLFVLLFDFSDEDDFEVDVIVLKKFVFSKCKSKRG